MRAEGTRWFRFSTHAQTLFSIFLLSFSRPEAAFETHLHVCVAQQDISRHIFFLVSPDNSDLIACMVVSKEGGQAQRFLAVDVYQMSLVEPETKRLGWGVVKFAGLLQVCEKFCVLVCTFASSHTCWFVVTWVFPDRFHWRSFNIMREFITYYIYFFMFNTFSHIVDCPGEDMDEYV